MGHSQRLLEHSLYRSCADNRDCQYMVERGQRWGGETMGREKAQALNDR